MKPLRLLLPLSALLIGPALRAQEPLAADELARGGRLLAAETARLERLPFRLELAPERASGLKAGEAGALFLPDQRILQTSGRRHAKDGQTKERKAGRGAAQPVGQLWLARLVPLQGELALSADALRRVKVTEEGRERDLVTFTLGIEKVRKSGPQLALHGRDGAVVLRVPLTAEKAKGGATTLTARKLADDRGVLELRLQGRYRAEIPVTLASS